jgi:hypothetical protein
MRRRLELASVEAVSFGCLPILEKGTAPLWVTEDMAVLIDRARLNSAPGLIADSTGVAPVRLAAFKEAFLREEDPAGKTMQIIDILGSKK